MEYNATMATHWKITPPQNKSTASAEGMRCAGVAIDAEELELEKLSRGATRHARESMRLIDAQKAEFCRKQMLKDILSTR